MLRTATESDFAAVTGKPAPGDWFGLVSARPHLIEGMGLVYRDINDRWWLSFVRCPGVTKVKTAHAGAKQLLALADQRGVIVNALADPEISGAAKWIERLGFRRTDETQGGLTVWTRFQ